MTNEVTLRYMGVACWKCQTTCAARVVGDCDSALSSSSSSSSSVGVAIIVNMASKMVGNRPCFNRDYNEQSKRASP